MAMLSLFDKNNLLSNLWEDSSSFAIKSEIKTIVPMMAKEATIEIAAVVVVATVPAAVVAVVATVAVVVVVATTVVVVVVTVVIISASTPSRNAKALHLICICGCYIYTFSFLKEKGNKTVSTSQCGER